MVLEYNRRMSKNPADANVTFTDGPDTGPDTDVAEAWREEIFRRLREIDRGAVRPIPWHETRRRLRARLRN